MGVGRRKTLQQLCMETFLTPIVHYRSLDILALLDPTSEVKIKANLSIGLEIVREALLKGLLRMCRAICFRPVNSSLRTRLDRELSCGLYMLRCCKPADPWEHLGRLLYSKHHPRQILGSVLLEECQPGRLLGDVFCQHRSAVARNRFPPAASFFSASMCALATVRT